MRCAAFLRKLHDKQTIQLNIDKIGKIRGNFSLFFAVKQTLSLTRNTIQSGLCCRPVVQYFLTISQFFFLKLCSLDKDPDIRD